MIREVRISDAQQLCDIYNYYIKHTVITFEEELLQAEDMITRIRDISAKYTWIVYEENDEIIGYAYASKWRERSAYRFVVETTVYLKNGKQGKGIGTVLYAELIELLKIKGFRVLLGCITLPNEASVKLHENFGFVKVAHFPVVGHKFNQWLDVGFWQLVLSD